MTNTFDFDWYKFYELGCNLLDENTDESLRTAINRFYYAAFCYARDYLIDNNIFIDDELEEQLKSGTGKSHKATRVLFKYGLDDCDSSKGKTIYDKLYELREYRNRVDYNKESISGLYLMSNRSKIDSKKIFDLIGELSAISIRL